MGRGSMAFPILRATSSTSLLLNNPTFKSGSFLKALVPHKPTPVRSYSVRSGLKPPDLPSLAQPARISLTPYEIEDFAPKIQQVVDWFGQLQGVDLQSVQPSIRADTGGQNLRDDLPETFKNRESMIAAVPNYEDPFIKVPKVLNKE